MNIKFFDYHMVDEQPSFIEEYETPNEICDHLDFIWHSLPHLREDGKVGGGDVIKEIKNSKDITFTIKNFNVVQSYLDHIIECSNQYVKKYFSDIGLFIDSYGIEMFNIQHYEPSGGFGKWHCERSSVPHMNRFLTFMTYLTDTPNAGTEFLYQNKTFECVKGKTLIWPTDFTHTHRGVISHKHEKRIATGWVILYDKT